MRSRSWVLLVIGLLSCPSEPPATEDLNVALSGCVEIRPESGCLYSNDAKLTIWVEALPEDITVRVDDVSIEPAFEVVGLGARMSLAAEQLGEELIVSTLAGGFRLGLERVETDVPTDAARWPAYELHQQGIRLLRAGEVDRSYAVLRAAELAAQAASDAHRQRELASPLTYIELVHRGDYAAAEHRLLTLPAPLGIDGEARSYLAWSRGSVARLLGDRRAALAAFREAAMWARRVDFMGWYAAENELATVMMAYGRLDEAVALLDRLASNTEVPACDRLRPFSNAAWARLRIGTSTAIQEAEPLLKEALEAFTDPDRCPNQVSANNQRINLAFARLETNDPKGAAEWLRQLQGDLGPVVPLWRDLFQAQVALMTDKAHSAATAFSELAERAVRARDDEVAWLAYTGAGRAFVAAGALARAVERLSSAETLVMRNAMLLPAQEGRFDLLADRAEGAQALVDALVRLDRVDEAFEAARRARRRAWLTLSAQKRRDNLTGEARSAWAKRVAAFEKARAALEAHQAGLWSQPDEAQPLLSAKEQALAEAVDRAMDAALDVLGAAPGGSTMPALPADALVLLPFGPRLFVAQRGQLTVEANDGPASWAAAAAAHPQLAVRLLARRPEEAVALGARLASGRPIHFSFDLPTRTATTGRPLRILAVSDPRGDLAAARGEGRAVADAHGDAARIEPLSGRAATRSALQRSLRATDVFHFAGHGRRAGTNGWDSALLLADSEFRVSDILLTAPIPKVVVLSACEGAKSGGGATAGIGLAQAFVVAGAEAVVAAHRTVDSDVSRAFAEAFHVELAQHGPNAVGQAFAATVQRLRQAGTSTDAFLLLVR